MKEKENIMIRIKMPLNNITKLNMKKEKKYLHAIVVRY